jgi:hypothetical protein
MIKSDNSMDTYKTKLFFIMRIYVKKEDFLSIILLVRLSKSFILSQR